MKYSSNLGLVNAVPIDLDYFIREYGEDSKEYEDAHIAWVDSVFRPTFKNFTPHSIIVLDNDGNSRTYPPNGAAPRLEARRRPLGYLEDFSVVETTLGEPEGLPKQEAGTWVIVSALVAEHPSTINRYDLIYPGEAVRDSKGHVIACKGFCAGIGLRMKLLKKLTTKKIE